jgi:hypothetical protein
MQPLAVTGYRRLGVGGWPTCASAASERWRLATWTNRRGWRLASIVEEQASPRHGARGEGLRDAVARVTSRDSDGIVVPNLAHLAASSQDALLVLELILAAGGVFASIDERLDLSTASGRRRYLCLCGLSPCRSRSEAARAVNPVPAATQRGLRLTSGGALGSAAWPAIVATSWARDLTSKCR